MENSSHIVLYRKYRPQKFSDVVGQEHVTDVLKNALAAKALAHAYIFAGPRGTGKTSVARILAREVGCSDEDLNEIDGASNRNIDDVRQLREDVRSHPFSSPIKVYIIDEVHMFTKDSWNAFLKTLEEPPAHVMFIMATTELHKVPDTIQSRCQTFQFKKPTEAQLVRMVLSVAKKEGVVVSREAADLIALLGDGSFRDTQGVLQKVIAAANGNEVTGDTAAQILGAPKSSMVEGFVRAALGGNLDQGVTLLREAGEAGIDIKMMIALALRLVRHALLVMLSPSVAKKLTESLSERELGVIREIGAYPQPRLSGFLREFLAVYEAVGKAHIPELPAELALIRFCEGVQ